MSSVSEPAYWSSRYQQGQTGWDIGAPTPVFVQMLETGQFPLKAGATVLVPGCGYGHDALLLAKAGYEVIAVDFAPEPLAFLREKAYGLPITIYEADYFDLPALLKTPVDMILEYTCFCAIDPSQRRLYFETAYKLLGSGGWLVGLFFPIAPESMPLEGPPFPVFIQELEKLSTAAGFRLKHQENPAASHPARKGREALWLLQKP